MGAKKFAVNGWTGAAIVESLRPNYAWAQQVHSDDGRIKTKRLTVMPPCVVAFWLEISLPKDVTGPV